MARVILMIRKIVDWRAYNRANIVDLIPALTYRTNHPFSLSTRSFAIPFFCSCPYLSGSVSFLNTAGWRSEGNLTRKLHFPWRCLRLKSASFPFVMFLLYAAPRDPQRILVTSRPWNPRFAIFVFFKVGKAVPLTRYGPSKDYGVLFYRFYCPFRFIGARVNEIDIADNYKSPHAGNLRI